MKKMPRLIIPALVALLVSGPAWGETVKLGDLRERGGVHYKKFTDVPCNTYRAAPLLFLICTDAAELSIWGVFGSKLLD